VKNSVKKNNQIEKKLTKISILMLVLLVISVYAFNQIELAKNKKSNTEPDIVKERISYETKRLLVKKVDYNTDFDDNLNIIAEYNDMALIEYETTEETKKDYDYFQNQEGFIVESDIEIKIADATEKNGELIKYDNTNNPLNRIKNYDLETINETNQ
jgi:hypothetical protein